MGACGPPSKNKNPHGVFRNNFLKEEKENAEIRTQTSQLLSGARCLDSLVLHKRNSNKAETKEKTVCGEFGIALKSADEGELYAQRIFCKKWGCPRCGGLKAWQAFQGIRREAFEKGLIVFVTLTLSHTIPAEESVKRIKCIWNKFRVLSKREFGMSVPYIYVVEFQKSGHAHLHVLFDRFVEWQWLNDAWKSVGGGHVDVRSLDEKGLYYISKYFAKELNEGRHGRYRRVGSSRGIYIWGKRAPKSGVRYRLQNYGRLKLRNAKKINEVKVSGGLEKGFSYRPWD